MRLVTKLFSAIIWIGLMGCAPKYQLMDNTGKLETLRPKVEITKCEKSGTITGIPGDWIEIVSIRR